MDYERAVRERTLIIIAARALNKGEARVFNGRRLTNGVPSADPMRAEQRCSEQRSGDGGIHADGKNEQFHGTCLSDLSLMGSVILKILGGPACRVKQADSAAL